MSYETKSEAPAIHWRETASLGSHQFTLKPRVQMLLPGGIAIFRKFKKPGRTWGREKPEQFYDVIYDEDYVTEWLLNNVVNCFPNITHVEMRELFTKALKLRKERSEGAKDAKD